MLKSGSGHGQQRLLDVGGGFYIGGRRRVRGQVEAKLTELGF